MKPLTNNQYAWANGSLLLTTLIYLFINGAGMFETLVIVPAWTSNPPASLHIFHGEYGLDFKWFWIIAHSVHELTFIAAIILNWKTGRKKVLLIVFVLHFIVRIWTITFFAPVIIYFQHLPVSDTVDELLKQKALLWKNLNLVRVLLFTALSLALVPLNKNYRCITYNQNKTNLT
jgi:hypothetical protein